jgi:hypothetical protein
MWIDHVGYVLISSKIWCIVHYFTIVARDTLSSSQFINTYNLFGTFIGFAYQGKDIVSGFILEYSSLRDFGP